MKLQRYTLSAHEDFLRREMYVAREPDPSGQYMVSADVDALLARIRAAVEAERSEVEYVFGNWSVPDQKDTLGRWWDAQSALDALLAEGGV